MNVPKLRFKEFTDEWNTVDLSKIFNYFSTNSLSREQLANNGILKNIHYGDIHKKYGCVVDIDKEVSSYIKDLNYNNKYEKCRNNDLIFADASEDYDGIGKAIEIINVNESIVSGLHTILARDNDKAFSPMFKGYYFNSPIIHNQIRVQANGFKVFGISKETINSLNAKIPNKEEQTKIAKFLSLLDKKIELQTKKIEDLKLYKLSQMEDTFNRQCLQAKSFEDIAIINKGTQLNSEELIDDGNYYMLNGGISPSGNTNKYNCDANTITISEGGNSCGCVNFNKSKFWCGGHCYFIVPKDVDNLYLYQNLKYNENKIMALRVGSGLPNIQKRDLEKFKLKIHNDEDQVKIAKYLLLYDEKVDLEISKLKKLKELKKGLMQKMFV